MTTPSQPPQPIPPAPAKQSGGGCLKGCLIVTLVVVVLLIGGTILALTAGRAYVARHLPEWEARYPALALGIDLLSLRDQFATQGSPIATDGRQAGANDKALLPADVAVHPSPRTETYNISPDQVTAFQRVAGPASEVLADLRAAWEANDWSLQDEREVADAPVLIWQKGDRTCRLEMLPAGRDTEVFIRCSVTPKSD